MKYSVETIVCGAYRENAYLLCPEGSADCVLIDPGDDLARLEAALAGKDLRAILLTHGHFDHMLAAEPLQKRFGVKVYAHALEQQMLTGMHLCSYDPENTVLPCPTELASEALAEEIDVCGIRFGVLHTPGHTTGSVCYYDAENGILFSGDTLFRSGFGRMDLPNGSPLQMRGSLRKLFALPAETRVLCGHDSETTIGAERGRYRL